MAGRWFGGSPGAEVLPDAHLLAAVDAALAGSGTSAELVCTSVDRSAGVPRTGVALRLSAEPADPAGTRVALARALGGPVVDEGTAGQGHDAAPAVTALTQVRDGADGRCVRFPGQDVVQGRLSVADLVAATAIEEVVGVGVQVGPEHVVDTLGFLRPVFTAGRLRLVVEQGAEGALQPFEIADPHECCGGVAH
ncbi:hypothetical protein GCU67_19920 [Modestobacter muralis]|uniref:Uncharacterized protein n=1 Tax=Modestobacter muralis TaxID=1608614 RepID=A0A6P0EZB9_9ACTN|nr:hypothetical protein [Modestobacter muralis]NEK96415.1 hypothetical protein [Modestobacter muralis]NEN53315.1 hypothetical protein [Modestobacter muralis]